MAGEILRDVLTSGTRSRHFRTYSLTLHFAANAPSGISDTRIFKFDTGRIFLWTGICYQIVEGQSTSPNFLPQEDYTISYTRTQNSRHFQRGPQLMFSVAPATFNISNDNPTGEYVMFTDNDNLTVTVTPQLTAAMMRDVYVNLCGIEYIV